MTHYNPRPYFGRDAHSCKCTRNHTEWSHDGIYNVDNNWVIYFLLYLVPSRVTLCKVTVFHLRSLFIVLILQH